MPRNKNAKAETRQRDLTFDIAVGFLIVVVIIVVGVMSFGKYSHPIQKTMLLHSARTELTVKQNRQMYKVVHADNAYVKPSYYHYIFSPKRNLLIMQLGDNADTVLAKARHGSQRCQEQVTSAELSLNSQSAQLKHYDKKLGTEVLTTNRTMVYFAKGGHVGYSSLPTLQPTDK